MRSALYNLLTVQMKAIISNQCKVYIYICVCAAWRVILEWRAFCQVLRFYLASCCLFVVLLLDAAKNVSIMNLIYMYYICIFIVHIQQNSPLPEITRSETKCMHTLALHAHRFSLHLSTYVTELS